MLDLSAFDWDVRATCYRLFIEHAREPGLADLAAPPPPPNLRVEVLQDALADPATEAFG